jgi:hypothetical protein
MIDTCNLIYLWGAWSLDSIYMCQRLRLGTLHTTGYDLETNLIKAVEASKHANDENMPEYQFLQLRNVRTSVHRNNISRYLTAVAS